MIVLPVQKLVIVTPPKCGSTSLHSMFCVPEFGGIQVIDAERDKHTMIVPFQYRDSRVAMVVRNPYERAKSLWLHWRRFVDEQCEFETFVRALIEGEIDDWFYAWRLVDFADAVLVGSTGEPKGVDEVIRLERLRTDLRRLGLFVTLKHENAASDVSADWENDVRELVACWAECDLERWQMMEAAVAKRYPGLHDRRHSDSVTN